MTTLEEFLAEVAAEAGADRVPAAGGGAEYRRADRVFAWVNDNVVEIRLDPEIAEAALGTPDTTTSGQGADWVRLAPATLNDRELDRARAWFLSAWRNAAGKPSP